MIGYPEFETQYLSDKTKWGTKPLDNPEQPIDGKAGTIDIAETGYIAICSGFMGDEALEQQHYCDSVESATQWLIAHGCTHIVNLCDNAAL